MFEMVRHHAVVAAFSLRMAIQRQLEYPLFMCSWFIMNPIQWFSGIWILQIISTQFASLNGWDFSELTFLYGLGLLTHGLFVALFIQTWHIESLVQRGGFDRMLLRPMSVLFQFLVSNFNFIGLTDLLPGVIIFAIGCSKVHFAWTVPNVIMLLLVLAGGTLIRASLFMLMGSVAFWTNASRSLTNLTMILLDRTTVYPFTIYPRAFQMLLTFAIPIGFISFYPAEEFLGQPQSISLPFGLAVWTPIVGVLMFAFAQIVFRLGLKRYESAGS
ncbi:ABC transporter permease [Paenibacillus beijingensis]|uniref:ABC transporter permease n=1 Tax=Paenibacillus beijingensis TaxID=1126833 RepID=A0A0D5NQZ3_9BACL|nr:ABC-2 family transporter protein [Paenibacillus beijingensis]AJY77661.1 hypothetical protein VN24_11325 [Paenibacillus beijingensis]